MVVYQKFISKSSAFVLSGGCGVLAARRQNAGLLTVVVLQLTVAEGNGAGGSEKSGKKNSTRMINFRSYSILQMPNKKREKNTF